MAACRGPSPSKALQAMSVGRAAAYFQFLPSIPCSAMLLRASTMNCSGCLISSGVLPKWKTQARAPGFVLLRSSRSSAGAAAGLYQSRVRGLAPSSWFHHSSFPPGVSLFPIFRRTRGARIARMPASSSSDSFLSSAPALFSRGSSLMSFHAAPVSVVRSGTGAVLLVTFVTAGLEVLVRRPQVGGRLIPRGALQLRGSVSTRPVEFFHYRRRQQRRWQDPRGPGAGPRRLPAGNAGGLHHRRRPGARADGGQG